MSIDRPRAARSSRSSAARCAHRPLHDDHLINEEGVSIKKINPALPILLGAALAVSACAKKDETTNITSSDVVPNDESAVTDSNFASGTDPLADNAAGPDNAVIGNAAGELGNSQ